MRVGAAHAWVLNLTFSQDVRLRYIPIEIATSRERLAITRPYHPEPSRSLTVNPDWLDGFLKPPLPASIIQIQ